MRTIILAAIIALSMATSCALQAAEGPQQSEAEQERIRAWIKNRDEWLQSDEGKAYVFWLCSLSGEERASALEKAARSYLLVPPDVMAKTPDGEASGYRLLKCAAEKTSSLGYIWSNRSIRYTWSPLSGYTWSNFGAERLGSYTWSDQRVTLSGFTWSNREGAQRHA